MKKLALLLAAGATITGFAVGGAMAQSAPDFATADTDHDGFVSLTEAQAAYPSLGAQAFTQADANKDSKLDATEYGTLGGLNSATDTGNGNNNTQTSQEGTGASSSAAK